MTDMYLHNTAPAASSPTALAWQTPVNIAQTTTAIAVLTAANANRKALNINNRSDAELFVRYGAVATAPASATSFDFLVPARSTHRLTLPDTPTTIINCVFSAAGSGSAVFVEGQ